MPSFNCCVCWEKLNDILTLWRKTEEAHTRNVSFWRYCSSQSIASLLTLLLIALVVRPRLDNLGPFVPYHFRNVSCDWLISTSSGQCQCEVYQKIRKQKKVAFHWSLLFTLTNRKTYKYRSSKKIVWCLLWIFQLAPSFRCWPLKRAKMPKYWIENKNFAYFSATFLKHTFGFHYFDYYFIGKQ